MQYMYYILGVSGWIWFAIVALIMLVVWYNPFSRPAPIDGILNKGKQRNEK